MQRIQRDKTINLNESENLSAEMQANLDKSLSEMAKAEDQESAEIALELLETKREDVGEAAEDEDFNYVARRNQLVSQLKPVPPSATDPSEMVKTFKQKTETASPVDAVTTDELNEPFRNMPRDEHNETYKSKEPFLDIGRRGVAGVLTATEFVGEAGYQAITAVPKGLSVTGGLMFNGIFRAWNGTLNEFENFAESKTALDFMKADLVDPFKNPVVDQFDHKVGKRFRKWLDTEMKDLEDTVLDYVGKVPKFQRGFWSELTYKSSMIAAPFLPMVSGIRMILKTPKLLRNALRVSSSFSQALKKTAKDITTESLVTGVGTLNASIGGGAAWQITEELLGDSEYKDMGALMAVPGAFIGGTGVARYPVNVAFGVGIGAVGLFLGLKPDPKNPSNIMTRMLAISQGISFKDLVKMTPKELNDKVIIKGNKHLRFMQDVAEGLESLPAAYREPLKKAFQKHKEYADKYTGKKGEQLQFFLYQLTGLGIQQSIVKASMNTVQLGLLKITGLQIGKMSDLEAQQEVLNDQTRVLMHQFEKILDQPNLAKPENEEYSKILDSFQKQLDEQSNTGDDILLKIRDMRDPKNVFSSPDKIAETRRVADELFHYDDHFGNGSNLSSKEIIDNSERITERIKKLITKRIEKSTQVTNDAYDAFYQNDQLIGVQSLVDFASDVKTQGLLSSLTSKGTKAGRFIQTQADLVFSARNNTLRMMDGDDVQDTYNKLRDISELDDVVFRSNKGKSTIDFDVYEEELSKLTGEAKTERLREILGDMTTTDVNAFETLNSLIPPKYLMSDLLDYRSSIYTKLMQARGNVEGHVAFKMITKIDEVLDAHFDNKAFEGTELKKKYEIAKETYKSQRLPWKAQAGTEGKDSVYKTDHDYEDTIEPQHFFALFTKFKNNEVMENTFKNMFPNKEDKAEAAALFQITIGRILNNDFPKFSRGFINNLSSDQIAIMERAGMINSKQFHGLQKIIARRDEVKKALESDETVKLRKIFDDEVLPRLRKAVEKGLGENSELANAIGNAKTSDNLIQAMLDETTVTYPAINARSNRSIIQRGKEYFESTDTPEMANEFVETLGATKDLDRGTITTQVLRLIDESDLDSVEKVKVLESLEKLMIHKIYKDSFKLTPKRDMKAGMETVSEDSPWVAANHSGLLSEVNLVEMATVLEKARRPLRQIAASLDMIKRSAGMEGKRRNEKKVRLLDEIYEISRLSFAEIVNVPVSDIGSALAMSSLLSRFYSIARGVVSLKFVAGDAFLRIRHQKKMEYMTEILSNPQAVETIHDVLVKGKSVTGAQVKYWKGVLAILIGAKAVETIKENDLEQLINHYFSSDMKKLLNVKPNSIRPPMKRYNKRVIFSDEEVRKAPFIDPALVDKMKLKGQANRPSKYSVSPDKIGMPKQQ